MQKLGKLCGSIMRTAIIFLVAGLPNLYAFNVQGTGKTAWAIEILVKRIDDLEARVIALEKNQP